jgi:hypothetical protein
MYQNQNQLYQNPPVQPGYGQQEFYLRNAAPGCFVTNANFNYLTGIIIQAMQENRVTIRESGTPHLISGKAPIGINPFGIKVECRLSNQCGAIYIQFHARLTDAFDTFNHCGKLVNAISASFQQQSYILASTPPEAAPFFLPMYGTADTIPPSSLVVTARTLAILGLFIPILTPAALIMALCSLGRPQDKKIALQSLIISVISLFLIIFFLIIIAAA